MPCIIAPIYDFFNHNANTALYGIAEPFTLVNGQMNRQCLSLTSAAVPAYVADKRVNATSASAHEYYNIFLYLFIMFYIATGNWDTIWAPKH